MGVLTGIVSTVAQSGDNDNDYVNINNYGNYFMLTRCKQFFFSFLELDAISIKDSFKARHVFCELKWKACN